MSDTAWRNRIVGYADVAPDQLLANDQNWRGHPQHQQDVLTGTLNEIGWLQDVIVNKRTSELWPPNDRNVETMLDGHLRVMLAMRHNQSSVPIKYVDLTPDEERLALLTFDPISALAFSDAGKLDALLKETQSDNAAVNKLLADLAHDAGLTREEEIEDAEPQIDRLDEVVNKWHVQYGQIYIIGDHKLLCGDSLLIDDIEKIMGDEVPDIVIADPPYGVNIVAANGYVGGGEAYDIPFGGRRGNVGVGSAHIAKTGMTYMESNKLKRLGSVGAAKPFGSKEDRRGSDGAAHVVDVGKYAPIIGDDTTETAIESSGILLSRYPEAVHVWWGANYYADTLKPSQCWIVWNKETTGNFADCELAWTNQDRAARLFTHRWNGMLRDSEREKRWHPTQKPAALAQWVFSQFVSEGNRALDPFCGAGWTMLAGERSGVKVRAIEKSTENCCIILERMALAFPSLDIHRA